MTANRTPHNPPTTIAPRLRRLVFSFLLPSTAALGVLGTLACKDAKAPMPPKPPAAPLAPLPPIPPAPPAQPRRPSIDLPPEAYPVINGTWEGTAGAPYDWKIKLDVFAKNGIQKVLFT
ncbi:MAG: hypothetical protein LBC63_06525, partial [Holophagales bacterium]|nr:hypothetical protein [Holophagales bacterium]